MGGCSRLASDVSEDRRLLPADENTARYLSIAEGLLVTLILGSTLVVVKRALDYLGPLTISGLRYTLAFVALLPLMLRHGAWKRRPSKVWVRLLFIGLSFYVVGNGALFLGLRYIPATTGALLLSLTPLLVLFGGAIWLRELPTPLQGVGVAVGLMGSIFFFSPGLKAGEPRGIATVSIGLVGIAAFGVLGREIARERWVDTLSLTAIPLAIGGAILLPVAVLFEGPPKSSVSGWGLVLWLAIINTAGVYLLYNHALKALAALEMSVIVNLTPLVTALWAWLLLGEKLRFIRMVGMFTVVLGVILVQRGKQSIDDDNALVGPKPRGATTDSHAPRA